MSVKKSIVRAFLKLNIFARTPNESSFISEEELLESTNSQMLEDNLRADYEEELEDDVYVRVYRSRPH